MTAKAKSKEDAMDPGRQVALLRSAQGLTQGELAQKVGTQQSSIARLESGNTQPSLSFLRRVAEALGGRLDVRIVMPGEPFSEQPQPSERLSSSVRKIVRAPAWQFPEMD